MLSSPSRTAPTAIRSRIRPWHGDVLIATLLVIATLPATLFQAGQAMPVGMLLAPIPAAAVAFRSLRPVPSTAVILITGPTAILWLLTDAWWIDMSSGQTWRLPLVAVGVAIMIALFTLYRMMSRRYAWATGALVALAAYLSPHVLSVNYLSSYWWFAVVAALGSLIVADGTRSRGEVRAAREENATVRQENAERVRQQATMAERARIAREMHDVLAHSVSRIAVEAETAPYTLKNLDPPARQAFAQIAETARETLTEVRRLLGVLRADSGSTRQTTPQPGMARLPDLLTEHRVSGGTVELEVIGTPRDLPPAIDLSAYRIIQEALTNVRNHAHGAHTRIELAYLPELLSIQVSDDGPGFEDAAVDGDGTGSSRPTGNGLIGMRERAAMLGGSCRITGASGSGVLVDVSIPLEER